ncbi:unnamed protein product [Peniophora sp. CBMAI 1063]|nr:unnamed protein product [Peniophora sp. CBMAI 1063]
MSSPLARRSLFMAPFNSTSHPGLVLGHLDDANSSSIQCTDDETHAACVRREHTHEAVANAPLILLYFFALGALFFARRMIAQSVRRTGMRGQEGLVDSVRTMLGYEPVRGRRETIQAEPMGKVTRPKSVAGFSFTSPAIVRRTRSASQ